MNTPEMAACAIHVQVPAVGLCQRCGNYMCSSCRSLARQDWCAECGGRLGSFLLRRHDFRLMEAFSCAWVAFSKRWLLSTFITALWLVVLWGSVVMEVLLIQTAAANSLLLSNVLSYGLQVVNCVIAGLGLAAQFRFAVVALEGHTPTSAHLVQGLQRAPGIILVQLAYLALYLVLEGPLLYLLASDWWLQLTPFVRLPLMLGCSLVIIPVHLYLALGIGGASIELAIDPEIGTRDALRRSWDVARGQRHKLLGGTLLGTAICLVSLIFCGVGAYPAAAFLIYFWTATHMALRDGVVPRATPFPVA